MASGRGASASIALSGLGRYDAGLVGDLGLVKLLASRTGRWPEAAETAELLEPYGEWQGLASVFLLAGLQAGARARCEPGSRSAGTSPLGGVSGTAPDGSPVALYARLPPLGEPELIHDAIPAGAEILELGAGAGQRHARARRLGHPVVAVDNSAEMLALVRGAETRRRRHRDARPRPALPGRRPREQLRQPPRRGGATRAARVLRPARRAGRARCSSRASRATGTPSTDWSELGDVRASAPQLRARRRRRVTGEMEYVVDGERLAALLRVAAPRRRRAGRRPALRRPSPSTRARRSRLLDRSRAGRLVDSANGRAAQDRDPRCGADRRGARLRAALLRLARGERDRRDRAAGRARRGAPRALRRRRDALEPRRRSRRRARRHRREAAGHRRAARRDRRVASSPSQTVLSVAAAIPTAQIESRLAAGVPVVRAMPNTPSTVHEGIAGLCAGAHASDEHLDLAEEALSHLGRGRPRAGGRARRDHGRLGLRARVLRAARRGDDRGRDPARPRRARSRRSSSCRRCSARRSSCATRRCTRSSCARW